MLHGKESRKTSSTSTSYSTKMLLKQLHITTNDPEGTRGSIIYTLYITFLF